MSEYSEHLHPNPAERLNQFVRSEHERMAAVGAFLAEALPVVEDTNTCNAFLVESGRPDLAIVSPARMMDIESPLEILERSNNFAPNFQVSTDFREATIQELAKDPSLTHVRIPITSDELDDMTSERTTPNLRGSHATKPAFARMLMLFPDFTRKLTMDFSTQGHEELSTRYTAELFAAYQLMSRLVDQNDQNVMRNGQVDNWYLCR